MQFFDKNKKIKRIVEKTETDHDQNPLNKGESTDRTPREGKESKSFQRQIVMENFRARVLRNLDIAMDIIWEEGSKIIKKYSDLNFYLDNIAGDKIFAFKAKERVRVLKKHLDAVDRSVDSQRDGKGGPIGQEIN